MKYLEDRFDRAYQIASAINQEDLPPDVMLRLYAYYKLATKDRPRFPEKSHETNIRNAFKFNAYNQLQGTTITEAKIEYIKIVESIINKIIN